MSILLFWYIKTFFYFYFLVFNSSFDPILKSIISYRLISSYCFAPVKDVNDFVDLW